MITPAFFYAQCIKNGVGFFSGVPDSLLKSFCAYITDKCHYRNHIVAVNEGAAVALGAGYHLATGKIPLVYMQNSGIGNAINPLLSLADSDVYQIPMILVVGWRGRPGVKDEPQHIKQGKVTLETFDALKIPYAVIGSDDDALRGQMAEAFEYIGKHSAPYAFIVEKDVFAPYTLQSSTYDNKAQMSREEAIEVAISLSNLKEAFIATTGMASRELYETRLRLKMNSERDFLTVGSMGHCAHIALGAALAKPDVRFTCLDGDGSLLMHLGAMAAVGAKKLSNFRHILLNNCAHDSVGGQPTIAPSVNFGALAKAVGYKEVYRAVSINDLRNICLKTKERIEGGSIFIEVLVRKGARKNLGRPQSSPVDNKKAFMSFL
ncbi:MAG: phosphonopyruvate decarboxylase, partial [Elusimicrobiota bacterium]|nr:phosphonopyruvate decarboxylase [Elusimicrobiota bacterium]